MPKRECFGGSRDGLIVEDVGPQYLFASPTSPVKWQLDVDPAEAAEPRFEVEVYERCLRRGGNGRLATVYRFTGRRPV